MKKEVGRFARVEPLSGLCCASVHRDMMCRAGVLLYQSTDRKIPLCCNIFKNRDFESSLLTNMLRAIADQELSKMNL